MPDSISPEANLQRSMRWPVKRAGAESYLTISVTVFALTVILTRLFLQLTGFPQLGGGVLHFAHALWGGLLLIVAAWVPLILANEWALALSAGLSGLGVGLFIDEVGKFITRQNDYFFPPAAPLIYGFFMILVLLLLVVRKTSPNHPRNELYRALTGLAELVDVDLDAHEYQVLDQRLTVARQSAQPQVAGLAAALQAHLRDNVIPLVPGKPNLWRRFTAKVVHAGQRLGRQRHRALILLAMALVVAGSVLGLLLLVQGAGAAHSSVLQLLRQLLAHDEIAGAGSGFWFYLRIALELLVSAIALASVLLLLGKRERQGINAAFVAMLLSLTGGTLLAFYLDQFGAVLTAVYQFLVLLVVQAYRQWYLAQQAPLTPT